MSELIDREALLDECLNHYEVGNIEQNCTMDWICKTVRNFPAASPWHRVEEPPKDACDCLVCWTTIHDAETGEVTGHGFWCEKGWYEDGLLGEGFYCQSREETHPVRVEPDYWMPIPEPPKEDA